MTADRVALILAVAAAALTVTFAATRRRCHWCGSDFTGWRALQRHISLAHRE